MATVHDDGEEQDAGPLVLVKGAPERVSEMCDTGRGRDGGEEPLDTGTVIEQSEALAAEGLRVLAMGVGRGEEVARAVKDDDPQGLTFVGMQGLLDPPRTAPSEPSTTVMRRASVCSW